MNNIQEIKKQYKKLSRQLDWERDVKSWDWNRLLSESHKFQMSIKDIQDNVVIYGNNPKIKIQEFKYCSDVIKNKIVKIKSQQQSNKKINLWQYGYSRADFVITIPANTSLTLELHNNIFQFWANLYFIIGSNSQVTILDKHYIHQSKFGAGSVDILLSKNSQVDYGIDVDDNSNYHMNYNFTCAENSVARVFAKNKIKAQYNYNSININHYKNNSHGEITWIIDALKQSKSYFYVANNHFGKDTTADMVIKTVGRDKSQVKLDGWINIGPKGVNTDSYLSEDVLIVSDSSSVKAEPNLEILNNDVKASHGATLGNINENQLLYLQSRGMSKREAKKMIIDGFLQSVNNRIKNNFIKDFLKN